MKKVLIFIESLAGGGAEKVLSDIVANLDREKYDVTVCTVTDGDIYQEKVAKYCNYCTFLHISDYHAGGFRKIRFWIQMKLIYKMPASLIYRNYFKNKYDIEIAFVEGFATKLIAASNNPLSKKIAWVHIDMQNNPYADSCYKSHVTQVAAYRKFDKVLCVSKSVKNAFSEKFFNSENTLIQYNPVDEKNILIKSEEQIDLEIDKKPVLVTVGRLEQQKGFLRLVDCAKAAKDRGADFSIWIIGEGSQRALLEKKIKEDHLEQNVHLLGFQSNPYKFISKADAFICSSYSEGFSTAATEAIILGKPIFTVDCAGMRELFGSEECGKIVKNNDQALSDLVIELALKTIDIQKYSTAAKNRGLSFRLQNRMTEIENIFDND